MTDAAKIVLDFKEVPVVVGDRLLERTGLGPIIATAGRGLDDCTEQCTVFLIARHRDLTPRGARPPLNEGVNRPAYDTID